MRLRWSPRGATKAGPALAEITEAEVWPGEPPTRFFCRQVETRLREIPGGKVAVVGGPAPEQLAMFRAADVVAGYAGSAMFTLAMCPEPTRVIALAPDAYTGRNEYGIASVWGHRLSTVWSASEVSHPQGGWTREAFWAPFTFDFGREGRFLEALLADLER